MVQIKGESPVIRKPVGYKSETAKGVEVAYEKFQKQPSSENAVALRRKLAWWAKHNPVEYRERGGEAFAQDLADAFRKFSRDEPVSTKTLFEFPDLAEGARDLSQRKKVLRKQADKLESIDVDPPSLGQRIWNKMKVAARAVPAALGLAIVGPLAVLGVIVTFGKLEAPLKFCGVMIEWAMYGKVGDR